MRRYASVKDIEARWRTLTSAEAAKADALIDDATALIIGMGAVDDGSQVRFMLIKSTVANMVIRSMAQADAMHGVNQYSQTVGAVSESWQVANPTCDLYLTRQEKKALGIGSSRAWYGDFADAGECPC